MARRLSRGLLALVLWAAALGVPLWWAARDVCPETITTFLVVVLVLGIAPGVVLWRAVRPADDGSWAEDIAIGAAVGLVLGLAGQVAAVGAEVAVLAVAVPFAPLAVLLVPSRRQRVWVSRCRAAPWWVHLTGSAAAVLAAYDLQSWFSTEEFAPGDRRSVPYVDTHFHLSIVTHLVHRPPDSMPALLGEPLDYHWFTHGWMAWVSAVGGLDPAVVLMRLQPAVFPALVALAVIGGARRLSGRWAPAAVALVLAFVSAQASVFHGAWLLRPVIPASPTLAPGVVLTMAVLCVLVVRWRRQAGAGALLLAVLFVFVASGTKGSTMPPLLAGVAAAAAAGLVWRTPSRWRVWADLGALTAALAAAVVVVFRGGSGGLRLDVAGAIQQTSLGRQLAPDPAVEAPVEVLVLAAVAAVVGTLALAGGLAVLAVDVDSRREPALWVGLGAAVMSAVALVVLAHPGTSQVYFLLSSLPVTAVGSAGGLVRLVGLLPSGWARPLIVAVPAAAAVLAVTGVPGWRDWGGADIVDDAMVLAYSGVVVVGAGLVAVLVLVAWAGSGRRMTALATAVAVLGLVGAVGSAVEPLRAYPAAVADVPVQPILREDGPVRGAALRYPHSFSQEMVDAARWLRSNSDPDTVVMVNRHCSTARRPVPRPGDRLCDTRRWFVSAFSERQAFVESWAYTATALKLNPGAQSAAFPRYWDPARLALNDGFYFAPTGEAARRLWCLGVRWVHVDRMLSTPSELDRFTTLRFRNVDAEVRSLDRPPGTCAEPPVAPEAPGILVGP
ncbi:MAG: hypothetical protein ACRCYX_03745 [Dermatophilaceae bacterium]